MIEAEVIEVAGYWSDESPDNLHWTYFGRIPLGYSGALEDLPQDSKVSFWLEHNQPLIVGEDYGDFVVQVVSHLAPWGTDSLSQVLAQVDLFGHHQ